MSALSPDDFKNVMRRWAAGVTVVTTRLGLAVHGFTATSFASVSAAPPLICISLARSSHTYQLISQSHIFAVNILGEQQQDVSARFASAVLSAHERFADEPFHHEATGAPVFDRAVAFVDCRLHAEFEVALNSILVGRVESGRVLNAEPPLIYADRRYWRLRP